MAVKTKRGKASLKFSLYLIQRWKPCLERWSLPSYPPPTRQTSHQYTQDQCHDFELPRCSLICIWSFVSNCLFKFIGIWAAFAYVCIVLFAYMFVMCKIKLFTYFTHWSAVKVMQQETELLSRTTSSQLKATVSSSVKPSATQLAVTQQQLKSDFIAMQQDVASWMSNVSHMVLAVYSVLHWAFSLWTLL